MDGHGACRQRPECVFKTGGGMNTYSRAVSLGLLLILLGTVLAGSVRAPTTLDAVQAQELARQDVITRLQWFDAVAYRRALAHMQATWRDEVPIHPSTIDRMKELEERKPSLLHDLKRGDEASAARAERAAIELLHALDRQLLANPLIEGKQILALRRELGGRARHAMSGELGIAPSNFQNNSELHSPGSGWNNVYMMLQAGGEGYVSERLVYEPPEGVIVSDAALHHTAGRMLFSSVGTHDRWHIFELDLLTGQAHQVTPEEYRDFDSFEPMYTADDRVVFASTATFLGLPCTDGHNKMSGLFLYDPELGATRQLTFDQDSNWNPVLMNDGRVLYLRWEYADLPHSNSRILFTMNPDGTGQQAYYGSGSYFPASFFHARPIPGHPTAVVGTASGHHGVSRSGRMMVLDPALGRRDAEGVVAEIPYFGREVVPVARDRLVDGVWPQFLHPYPLSDTYFLVSMKAHPGALWGMYLVDLFGNMTLLRQSESAAWLEPMLAEPKPAPPHIPDRVRPEMETATIYLQDVYEGPGLQGIPRGEVKRLRVSSYGFSPWLQGGLLGSIGMDGPWDIRKILGTVEVEPDGSVLFEVPANTPIAVHPLDEQGKALQIMRSWFTAMPGEVLSCVGCHEDKNRVPLPRMTIASVNPPQAIEPWYGPARGFGFTEEIQPILDRACVACHNPSRPELMNLQGDERLTDWTSQISGRAADWYGGQFSVSYAGLHRFVRRPGIESDMAMLAPMDVHADQTELMHILNKGHHAVQLSTEEIEKIATWIDFNAPYHGHRSGIPTWPLTEESRRLRAHYADLFGLAYSDVPAGPRPDEPVEPVMPPVLSVDGGVDSLEGWPVTRGEIEHRQMILGEMRRQIPLTPDVTLDLVKIPGGSFIMGGYGHPDEMPRSVQQVEPFWMGQFEVTNAMYALFDADHDSRYEHRHGYQFGREGYPLNHPDQPVVRVSWNDAMAFTQWLSEQTGLEVRLPTEAEWEWAARAGTDTDWPFGNVGDDYSLHANLGDITLREFAACTAHKNYESVRIIDNPGPYDDWIPRDTLYDDRGFVSQPVGSYRPNYFDLYDMHGNVWEWTLSAWKPYPYNAHDGRNAVDTDALRVVRGGSWRDRPHRSTSSYRLFYRPYQGVYNVGFRVVVSDAAP